MCASRAALFLWHQDVFSCRNAHPFNRLSSRQPACCHHAARFPLVTRAFSRASSPPFPSFRLAPQPLLLPSIEATEPAEMPDYPGNNQAQSNRSKKLTSRGLNSGTPPDCAARLQRQRAGPSWFSEDRLPESKRNTAAAMQDSRRPHPPSERAQASSVLKSETHPLRRSSATSYEAKESHTLHRRQ